MEKREKIRLKIASIVRGLRPVAPRGAPTDRLIKSLKIASIVRGLRLDEIILRLIGGPDEGLKIASIVRGLRLSLFFWISFS